MTGEEKKELQRETKNRIGLIFWNIFFVFCVFLIGWRLSIYVENWQWWMFFLWVSWLVFLLVYPAYVFLFKFAPEGIFITQVEEGTGKIIMKMGQAFKGIVQYKGFDIDEEWNIVPVSPGQEEKYFFGGIRWVGLWPIYYIHRYALRWTSIRENGETAAHEEVLSSILLKEKIYYLSITGAEDKDGIAVDIDILITLKVVNLYRALFGPHNYLEQVISRTRPLFREYARGYTFMELASQRQRAGGELWERLEKEGMVNDFGPNGEILVIGEFERDYGIRIKDGGIEIKNITPPPEYQNAQTRKYIAAREAERVAGETIGSVVNMMAISRGITAEQMQEKIDQSPKFQKEFRDYCKDTLHKKMAIDGGSYVKIDVTGAGGTEKTLMDLAAAWLRMPKGLQKTQETSRKEEEDRDKKIREVMRERDKREAAGGEIELG